MAARRSLRREDKGVRGARRGTLRVTGALDLGVTFGSGQTFRWEERGGWWWGFVAGDLVRLRWNGPERRALAFESARGAADEAALSRYLRLGEAWGSRVSALAGDPLLARAAARFAGLRVLRQDPWEALVSFIVSANSNIPKIARTLEALAARSGEPAELGGSSRPLFPEPEALSALSMADLRETSMGYRAAFVRAVARAVAEGLFDPELLPRLPPEEARARLLELPGVGEKVADCVLLFTGADDGAFPVDVWVQRAVEALAFRGRSVSARRVREWARDRWGRDAGLAQQWLFHGARSGLEAPAWAAGPRNTRRQAEKQ